MPRNYHIVFSRKPQTVSDDEFNSWYEDHVSEILALDIPGFVGAKRYRLDAVVDDGDAPKAWDYVTLWEIEGDPDAAIEEQTKRGLNSKASYVKLKETEIGGPPLPTWWDEVRFASWNAQAVGDREVADRER